MSTPKTDSATGWGMRVGGPKPYLAWGCFEYDKRAVEAECKESYHRPMKCVLVPLREYLRLKRRASRSSHGGNKP